MKSKAKQKQTKQNKTNEKTKEIEYKAALVNTDLKIRI